MVHTEASELYKQKYYLAEHERAQNRKRRHCIAFLIAGTVGALGIGYGAYRFWNHCRVKEFAGVGNSAVDTQAFEAAEERFITRLPDLKRVDNFAIVEGKCPGARLLTLLHRPNKEGHRRTILYFCGRRTGSVFELPHLIDLYEKGNVNVVAIDLTPHMERTPDSMLESHKILPQVLRLAMDQSESKSFYLMGSELGASLALEAANMLSQSKSNENPLGQCEGVILENPRETGVVEEYPGYEWIKNVKSIVPNFILRRLVSTRPSLAKQATKIEVPVLSYADEKFSSGAHDKILHAAVNSPLRYNVATTEPLGDYHTRRQDDRMTRFRAVIAQFLESQPKPEEKRVKVVCLETSR